MYKTRLFPTLLALLVFVAVVHIVAAKLYWYWTIPWIDRIPHLSAGALVALSSLWFLYLSGYVESKGRSQLRVFFISFFSALFIGLLWEFFEVYFHITSLSSPDYYRDNGGDILMDVLGGIGGYVYFNYKGYNKV